ncbi:DSN1 protein, partial [Todus mexicanus]|nr:DSN1 protein [Todus mexicanus]
KRRSWRRSSLKGLKHQQTLSPVYKDVTELSKSISLELPETERLAALVLACFQFSAQKLEQTLRQSDGFSPEAFRAHVDSVSEDMKRYVEKLKRDGTLQRCVDVTNELWTPLAGVFGGVSVRGAEEKPRAQPRSLLRRFSAECQGWEQLLRRHQDHAEEMARQLEECRRNGGRAQPADCLRSSVADVLKSKPDYQKILDEQREGLNSVELVLDEVQQGLKLVQSFRDESERHLQRLSRELAMGTFGELEKSPVRKLLGASARKMPPPP